MKNTVIEKEQPNLKDQSYASRPSYELPIHDHSDLKPDTPHQISQFNEPTSASMPDKRAPSPDLFKLMSESVILAN